MGLFGGGSKSKTKTTTNVTDRRIGASGGSIVASDGSQIKVTTADPAIARASLQLGKVAIRENRALATTALKQLTQARAQDRQLLSTVTGQQAAAREREQELLNRVLAPGSQAGADVLTSIVWLAGLAAGAFVLVRWGGRA